MAAFKYFPMCVRERTPGKTHRVRVMREFYDARLEEFITQTPIECSKDVYYETEAEVLAYAEQWLRKMIPCPPETENDAILEIVFPGSRSGPKEKISKGLAQVRKVFRSVKRLSQYDVWLICYLGQRGRLQIEHDGKDL